MFPGEGERRNVCIALAHAIPSSRMARGLPILVLGLLLLACGHGSKVVASARPADPLAHATLEALDREACPRLLTRTFPLVDGKATSGELWVRQCATRVDAGALDVQVALLGWQWVGQGSWGFSVREYAYFRATVHARIRAEVVVEGDEPELRVWSDEEPAVTVGEIGRVSARASTPPAVLLGFVSSVAGQSPNVLATSALRSHVADAIRTNAKRGVLVALREASPPGLDRTPSARLLDEDQRLEPSGALISGSFPPGRPMVLRYRVEGAGAALARAVCDDEAARFVDAIVANGAPTAANAPTDVLTLRGEGERRLPAPSCRWVLVTGPESETAVTLHVTLQPEIAPERAGTRRWVRATVEGYDVEGIEADPLLAFQLVHQGERRTLGRPLTSTHADVLSLVVGPIELANGEPLHMALVQLTAKRPHWWSGIKFDETALGDATLVPTPGAPHERKRVTIQAGGRAVGWIDLALDSTEVP
jgi:hypothetical protein